MTKKSFHEVGPPSKNNLRYISLPRLSEFTGACSDYLGSFGKRDQPFNVIVVVLIVVAVHKGLVVVDKSLSDTH